MNLKENINQEMQEYEQKINRLKTVQRLTEIFPDLDSKRDRWRNEYYVSATINPQVDKVEFKHSCGCCSDAPLLAFFYKVVDGIRIYADPFSIGIGENNPSGMGDYPDANWSETLRKYKIPVHMDEKVQAYFDTHQPEPFDDDDEYES